MAEVKYRQRNLTLEQKISIVTDYNAGMLMPDLCRKYDVSVPTIYRALRSMVEKKDKPDAN